MSSVVELNGGIIKRFCKKYLLIVVIFGILCGLVTSLAMFKLKGTEYQSTGTLIQNDNNYNLVQSYQQFIKSNKFTRLVDEQIDQSQWKNKSYKDDYSVALTAGGTTSPFFSVTVTTKDAAYAKFLTTTSMHLFIANIGKYLSGANVSIFANATNAHAASVKTKLVKAGLIAMIVGMLLATLIAVHRLIWVGKVPDASYLNDVYELKMLGTLDVSNELK